MCIRDSPKTVQYLAGHENSKITMDIYAKAKYNRPDEDVYKRQLTQCATVAEAREKLAAMRLTGTASVSYTHLSVMQK